ncbi:MAG: ATP-binding cassette domain-containing protein [Gammaproteobacteria bacterium]|nr:ATP-binding cassette domain-containing protein [Gammaproteobacteria bacterium]
MSLELQNLSASTPHKVCLFEPVNMVIEKGQIACIMGPSGVGKSTLLNAIGGHLGTGISTGLAITGEVLLNNENITHKAVTQRNIGILFQDPLLFPHLSVGDNLAFGLHASVVGKKQRRAQVEQALEHAQLSGFYHRNPATLSGGQQSRVALMRALLAQPQALLLDEPFSKLDLELRHTMRDFLFTQTQKRNIPVLLVTHDPAEAATVNGPVVVLQPSS